MIEQVLELEAEKVDIGVIDAIRRLHYPEGVLVPLQLYSLIISRQSKSTIIFKRGESVIGYYSLIALEENVYKRMMAHAINEKEIGFIENIPLIKTEEDFNDRYLYILSIVAKDLKDAKSNLLMFYSLKRRIEYVKQNFYIKGVFTEYFNPRLKKIFRDSNIKSIDC